MVLAHGERETEGVKIISNEEGLLGGIKLWQDVDAKAAPEAGVATQRRVKRRRVPTQT